MQELTDDITVFRNDAIALEDISNYDALIISPGPGLPEDAGVCIDAIRAYYKTKRILGICLGHQAIAVAFEGRLKNLSNVSHGVSKLTKVSMPADKIYKDVPHEFLSGRYHSWVVDTVNLPKELIITAVDEDNEIMSVRHCIYDVRGVQFHPESIMTDYGKKILKNWLK